MRYRIFLLVAALWGQSGCSDDALRSLDCVTGETVLCQNSGDITFDGVGLCNASKKRCEVGVWSECSKEINPTEELCDGSDNDCDGTVDETDANDLRCLSGESDRTIFYEDKDKDSYGDRKTARCLCANKVPDNFDLYILRDGDCNDEFDSIKPGAKELCDNLDNDCNEITDDVDYEKENVSLYDRLCYSLGMDSSFLNYYPSCMPGTKMCSNGMELCIGEKTPSPEICDLLDNDCDGLVNEGLEQTNRVYDIVLILDKSGSMQASIDVNKAAAMLWAEQFQQEQYKFALVTVAELDVPTVISETCLTACLSYCACDPSDGNCNSTCRNGCGVVCDTDIALITNFTDALAFSEILRDQDADGSGSENTYDVLKYVADGTLPLTWRENAVKIVVMFTDEEAQTIEGNLEPEVEAFCVNNDLIVYMFLNRQYVRYFDDIAYSTGGDIYNVQDWENEILENLNAIIAGACDIELP